MSVAVAVAVAVSVAVAVAVAVAWQYRLQLRVAVAVAVSVAVAVMVAVAVAVGVAVSVAVAVAVAVAVTVGTAPNAVPLRLTDWDAVLPSSVTVSFPVCAVPAGLVSVVGLKVTDTWQFPPAEIDDPHEFVTTSNGAVAPIDEISAAECLDSL